jgi:hypothetical protein
VSKVFKNIAVFSLWIAGLVIIAHLLIPHDHHSDCSVFNNDNECHAQNTAHHDKSPAFPMHCHALNDLTFEKASNTFLIYSDIPTCDLFILNRFDSCLPDSDLSCIKIKDFHIPLIETDLLHSCLFRGPPALV